MNIQQLLELALIRKASDLHLVVGYYPMLRIHGDLIPVNESMVLTDNDMLDVQTFLLNARQKQIFTTSMELDFSVSYQNRARFRVNFYRTQGHTAADFRLIPLDIPLLEDLGLPVAMTKFINLRQGLILVTGPTGHGKSTTLAAIINRINLTRAVNILTIEDPTEYVYPKGKSLVSQREMYLDSNDWAKALKAALREDPDVVLVGEMRDYETIAATITIAETGHLVFATLHTNSASQSVDRIIDTFPAGQQPQIRSQLADTLEAIVAQRLVPSIMPGRVLAVELLLKTPALASMIRDGKSFLIDNYIQTSAELGMVSMEASLARLVKEGKISVEVARSYSVKPEVLAKLIG